MASTKSVGFGLASPIRGLDLSRLGFPTRTSTSCSLHEVVKKPVAGGGFLRRPLARKEKSQGPKWALFNLSNKKPSSELSRIRPWRFLARFASRLESLLLGKHPVGCGWVYWSAFRLLMTCCQISWLFLPILGTKNSTGNISKTKH